MSTKEMQELFALNEEQKELLEEWKKLSEKMEKAGMQFIIDDYNGDIAVINANGIEELDDEDSILYDDYRHLDDFEKVEEFGIYQNYHQFYLPNRTVYNSDINHLYVKIKKPSAE